jgi:hypothetical protein
LKKKPIFSMKKLLKPVLVLVTLIMTSLKNNNYIHPQRKIHPNNLTQELMLKNWICCSSGKIKVQHQFPNLTNLKKNKCNLISLSRKNNIIKLNKYSNNLIKDKKNNVLLRRFHFSSPLRKYKKERLALINMISSSFKTLVIFVLLKIQRVDIIITL